MQYYLFYVGLQFRVHGSIFSDTLALSSFFVLGVTMEPEGDTVSQRERER